MDLGGFEPPASSVRLKRAPNCATGPCSILQTGFYLRGESLSRKWVIENFLFMLFGLCSRDRKVCGFLFGYPASRTRRRVPTIAIMVCVYKSAPNKGCHVLCAFIYYSFAYYSKFFSAPSRETIFSRSSRLLMLIFYPRSGTGLTSPLS